MAYDPTANTYRGLHRALAERPLSAANAQRACLAIEDRAVPLRPHETLALALPPTLGATVRRVEFHADPHRAAAFTVWCADRALVYAHPLRPPSVTMVPSPSAIDLALDAFTNGETVGGARIVRTEDGERIAGTDHPPFAEIQRDTVRSVNGVLRYVGWAESFPGHVGRVRLKPSLVVNGIATPIQMGDRVKFLSDGDDLYALTLKTERVREPERPGLFSPGDDGIRRDTRVRVVGGTLDVLVRGTPPDAWNFIAKAGETLVLTGSRLEDGRRCPTAVAYRGNARLDDGRTLVGHGHRLPNAALVACELPDGAPGFAWFADGDAANPAPATYPLYGPIAHIQQADPRTLQGWHVEGDTLFLTRYSRD